MKFSEYLNNLDNSNHEESINEAFSIDKTLKSTVKALERFKTHITQISLVSEGVCAYRLVSQSRMGALIHFNFKKNDVERLKLENIGIEAGATYNDVKGFETLLTNTGNEFLEFVNAFHETIDLFKEVAKSEEDKGVVIDHIARKLGVK